MVDNIDETNNSYKLRELTGYVPQFSYLFDTTIKNICLGAQNQNLIKNPLKMSRNLSLKNL